MNRDEIAGGTKNVRARAEEGDAGERPLSDQAPAAAEEQDWRCHRGARASKSVAVVGGSWAGGHRTATDTDQNHDDGCSPEPQHVEATGRSERPGPAPGARAARMAKLWQARLQDTGGSADERSLRPDGRPSTNAAQRRL